MRVLSLLVWVLVAVGAALLVPLVDRGWNVAHGQTATGTGTGTGPGGPLSIGGSVRVGASSLSPEPRQALVELVDASTGNVLTITVGGQSADHIVIGDAVGACCFSFSELAAGSYLVRARSVFSDSTNLAGLGTPPTPVVDLLGFFSVAVGPISSSGIFPIDMLTPNTNLITGTIGVPAGFLASDFSLLVTRLSDNRTDLFPLPARSGPATISYAVRVPDGTYRVRLAAPPSLFPQPSERTVSVSAGATSSGNDFAISAEAAFVLSGRVTVGGTPPDEGGVEARRVSDNLLAAFTAVTSPTGTFTLTVPADANGYIVRAVGVRKGTAGYFPVAFGQTLTNITGTVVLSSRSDLEIDVTTVNTVALAGGVVVEPGGGALGRRSVSAQQAAVTLRMTPTVPIIPVGGRVGITLTLEAGSQLVDGAEVYVNFNPSVLEIIDPETNQLTNTVRSITTFQQPLSNSVSNAAGTIVFAAGRSAGQDPLNGTIPLAVLPFRGKAEGVSFVPFVQPTAVSYQGLTLTVAFIPSTVTVGTLLPPPAAIVLNPVAGTAGSTTTVNGFGFDPNASVTLVWSSTAATLGTPSTDGTGALTHTVTIPANAPGGLHFIRAEQGPKVAVAPFTVTVGVALLPPPAIVLNPVAGTAGSTTTVNGFGFDPNAGVTIVWSSTATALMTPTTDGGGAFTQTVTIPANAPEGLHFIRAVQGITIAVAPFTVTVEGGGEPPPSEPPAAAVPLVSVSPHGGLPNSGAQVLGSGYNPNASATVVWSSTGATLATVTTDSEGAFTQTVTIPSSQAPGTHFIRGDQDSKTQRVPFAVWGSGPITISVLPETPTVGLNEVFTMTVQILAGSSTFNSVDLFLRFNPTYLRVVGPSENSPSVIVGDLPDPDINTVSNTTGLIRFSWASTTDQSGSKLLGSIVFKALTFTVDSPRTGVNIGTGTSILLDVTEKIGVINNARVRIAEGGTVFKIVFPSERSVSSTPGWRTPITITLLAPGQTTVLATITGDTDASGVFTATNVTPGTYDVQVKAPGALSFKKTDVTIGTNTTVDFTAQPTVCNTGQDKGFCLGNADGDEDVDNLDFGLWRQARRAIASCTNPTLYSLGRDFNGNCKIDNVDFGLWRRQRRSGLITGPVAVLGIGGSAVAQQVTVRQAGSVTLTIAPSMSTIAVGQFLTL
ncbi:MAG: hypothetical protein HY691_11980, partial [Chloroflexi bacterium]|nr:hypothetical protein [Chloroflexota bacterium]